MNPKDATTACTAMRENLVRRLAGDLELQESRELDRHLESCDDCARESRELEALWSGLGEIETEAEPPSPKLRERFDAMLNAEIRRGRPLAFPAPAPQPARDAPLRFLLPLAATLALGVGIGWLTFGRSGQEVAMHELRNEVGELQQLVALSMLQKSSVSERLQGVAYSREASPADERIANALVRTLAEDSNVNVRLAALEALRPVADRDALRGPLVAVAAKPDAPLVSLSVIDVLLEAGTPQARRDLEQLMNDSAVDPVIRGYLRDRLGRRI